MMQTTIAEIVAGDRELFPPYLYEAYRSTIKRAPSQPLIEVPLTIVELTGPGPLLSRTLPEDADLTTKGLIACADATLFTADVSSAGRRAGRSDVRRRKASPRGCRNRANSSDSIVSALERRAQRGEPAL